MRIIGIRVYDGRGQRFMSPAEVMKGVKDGWFPFGNYPEPQLRGEKWVIDEERCQIEGFYNFFSQWPKISVVGIVGKNGSGKSSLLDYLLMIVNNAACRLLYDQYAKDEQQPALAHGIYADLYYETDGTIRRLKCIDTDVTYSDGNLELKVENLNQYDRYSIASELFYIVMCNYGSYSLNSNDYVSRHKNVGLVDRVNGDWLDHIFNLEQNYIYPVTITPSRNGGNIDVNQLKEESVEKLIALMLFAKSRGDLFMPGYQLSSFKYDYDSSVRVELTSKIGAIAKRKKVGQDDLIILAESMAIGWATFTDCDDLYLADPEKGSKKESHEVLKMLLMYMGYQTLHLCVYYEKFRSKFDVIHYVEWHQNENIPYDQGFIKDIDKKSLLDTIQNDHTNLTYGIRKCLRTIREAVKTGIEEHPYLAKSGFKDANDIPLDGTISMEEILYMLPPPLFELDALLTKDDTVRQEAQPSTDDNASKEIQLSKLSSGEKQFLYSLTSALFHIKSMDESIASTKEIRFHHVCLAFDEAELYYHPEYQQNFIFNLLRYLSWINLVRINSVQIVIATHSPFILSDIHKDYILFMRDGRNFRENMNVKEAEEFNNFGTFGANYYDLLRNGFFLKDQPTGKFAAMKIKELLDRIKAGDKDEEVVRQVELIEDPLIKGYLLYEIEVARR